MDRDIKWHAEDACICWACVLAVTARVAGKMMCLTLSVRFLNSGALSAEQRSPSAGFAILPLLRSSGGMNGTCGTSSQRQVVCSICWRRVLTGFWWSSFHKRPQDMLDAVSRRVKQSRPDVMTTLIGNLPSAETAEHAFSELSDMCLGCRRDFRSPSQMFAC